MERSLHTNMAYCGLPLASSKLSGINLSSGVNLLRFPSIRYSTIGSDFNLLRVLLEPIHQDCQEEKPMG